MQQQLHVRKGRGSVGLRTFAPGMLLRLLYGLSGPVRIERPYSLIRRENSAWYVLKRRCTSREEQQRCSSAAWPASTPGSKAVYRKTPELEGGVARLKTHS